MHIEKIIVSLSKMLSSHAKTLVLILSLTLVGGLLYGLIEAIEYTSVVGSSHFAWMYFTVSMISFGIIITVIYLVTRPR